MKYFATTSQIEQYVTVWQNFYPENLQPFVKSANRKYLVPFVGDLYTELLEADTISGVKKEALILFEEALCNFSFYRGASKLILQINGAGVHTSSTGQHTKSTHFERLDWKRELLTTGHEALDHLLTLLEANPEEFTSYTDALRDSNKELLVQNTITFDYYYNIHCSRQTFLALIPTMRQVEDQYINTWLCEEYLAFAKAENPTTPSQRKLLDYLQKAVVAFTVAQTVSQGQFILDGQGIHLRFDRLPHENNTAPVKNNDFLLRTADKKEAAGYEYLKLAQAIIRENPSDFTQCGGNIITTVEQTAQVTSQIIISNNKRVIGL